MAKKKKKAATHQQLMSDKKYLATRAANLPLGKCYMSKEWLDAGLAQVIVTREHVQGNYTLVVFLVDNFCLGVKDVTYRVNISPDELRDILDSVSERMPMEEVDYAYAHNFIYAAVDWAEGAGIKPHPDFALVENILEEDNDDIPLMDIEMGDKGRYHLIAHNMLEASRYLPLLDKNIGEGNYEFSIIGDDFDDFEDEDYDYEDYEDYDEEELRNILENLPKKERKVAEKLLCHMNGEAFYRDDLDDTRLHIYHFLMAPFLDAIDTHKAIKREIKDYIKLVKGLKAGVDEIDDAFESARMEIVEAMNPANDSIKKAHHEAAFHFCLAMGVLSRASLEYVRALDDDHAATMLDTGEGFEPALKHVGEYFKSEMEEIMKE